jgi:hypothetical protein
MKKLHRLQKYKIKNPIYKILKYEYSDTILNNHNIIFLNEYYSSFTHSHFSNKGQLLVFSNNLGLVRLDETGISILFKHLEWRVSKPINIFEKIINYQIFLKLPKSPSIKEYIIDILIKE